MTDRQHFKTQQIYDRRILMHPKMQEILDEVVLWLKARGVDPEITETVTTLKEDAGIGRKSASHREGRAFDIRTRDWPRELVKEFEAYFEKKYGSLGAVGATTKVPNFLLFHDIGHGEHFHVQLNKSFAVKTGL